MPIVSTYKPLQIQPGMVHLSGIVILQGGPAINTTLTQTPGLTAIRADVGKYTLVFNDGVTVGFVAIAFTDIHGTPGKDPLTFSLLNASNMQAGSSQIAIECSDNAGALEDPEVGGGFSFIMTRLNTTIVVK